MITSLVKSSIASDFLQYGEEKVKKLGFQLKDMLIKCYFNDAPCNSSDWIYVYDYDFLNCYTFNSGYDKDHNKVPIKQINEAGLDKSLQLELFVGDDATQSQFLLNSGLRVTVHDQDITPIIISEGLNIATGFKTNVDIERSFTKKLDSPYSDCIKNVDSPQSFNSYFYKSVFTILNQTKYRQKICTKLCLQEYIKNYCGCIDGSLPNIYSTSNVTICATLNLLNCTSIARSQYYNDIEASSCQQCPKECDYITFNVEAQTVSRFPTSYYSNYLLRRTNLSKNFLNTSSSIDLTKSTLMANIFYDEIEVKYINEIPKVSLDSFLSNIGGNIGIYVGMSLMGIAKIVELIIQNFILFLDFKKQSKKKNVIFEKLKQKKSKIYIANTIF